MNFARLLAKSSKNPGNPNDRETLPRHIKDVVKCANAILESIGSRSLQAMKIGVERGDELSSAVLRGAWLHDIGKAIHQFQKMIRQGSPFPQALRHEWIGVWLLLTHKEFDGWLFGGCSALIRFSALFGALGHHLRLSDGSDIRAQEGSGDSKVEVFCDHADFFLCSEVLQEHLGLAKPGRLPRVEINLSGRPLLELRQWLPEAYRWFQQAGDVERRFISLVKALIIAADVAGSALPKHGQDPAYWTKQVLSRTCLETDLKEIAETRLGGFAPREFQKKVETSRSPVTFVRGGCGSGKTVAAYLWASRNATGRKLFFCYPTTGTATEGFRDYIIPSELSAQSLLLHSRSECDLEDLLKSQEEEAPAHAIRIESLAAWDVPLVICTADLVLGLIQNNRRSLFSFPSIANGAFIFDEIHQYDDRLFGALLRFLDTFQGAPILLMTASLPKDRQRAIQDLLAKRNIELQVIGGPIDLENLKRYRLEGPVHAPPWSVIEKTYEQGGKILWVGNTVDRCVGFAKESQRRGFAPLPYHSRYRYCDRMERHNAVIEAFKKPGPALAVTTQVCEVSLDISADLLVSDISTVPALIQRMGRLNRRVSPENPQNPKAVILLEPGSHLPYTKADLDLTRVWMSKLGPGPLSQADLALTFEGLAEGSEIHDVESAWLEGGPFNSAAPLREAGYTVSVIRPEDKSDCLDERGRPSRKQITLYAIPMTLWPVERELQSWERLQHAFVAPEGRIKYSGEWGGGWESK